ncbi:MAG: 30S ribosomal protein S6 [Candidatus Magasanikbacteria bacterium RIFOXYD2_FULL_41_14]|uniref:Small ribosomal subunit protein bS6 n=1 Tax=Candidatus Magasanikbacteria bacterium RIFOXYD2_FULL_41_14 TaxID=1798709 RepID=A0A1F6PDQ7_9BACT|nr:MAG: 30S ribosomal protein S6 [Candidatus Magasanikbacteria bacterium RIFOXYD2_FULL_41_14]
MKKYELLFILPGTLDDKEAKTRSEEICALVKEYDAEAEMTAMGKTRLAYPVKQIRYGYFYTVVFNLETDVVKTLQDKLTVTRDLLRSLITEYNEKYAQSRKLSYNTTASGITMVGSGVDEVAVTEEQLEDKPVASVTAPAKEADMTDINKKLDEILAGDVIPGV